MSPQADVLDQLLALPKNQRAQVIAHALRSLDDDDKTPPQDNAATVEQLWSDEIDARIAELESDPSAEIDSRTAIARARQALRRPDHQ